MNSNVKQAFEGPMSKLSNHFLPLTLALFALVSCGPKPIALDMAKLPERPRGPSSQMSDIASMHIRQATSQGDIKKAISLYKDRFEQKKTHDFPLLRSLATKVLLKGLASSDPQMQLMSVFASAFARSSHLIPCLHSALSSQVPMVQLAAVHALDALEDTRATQGLFDAMRSNYPLVRFEAISRLSAKRHPEAFEQAESLMYKLPIELQPFFSDLFAVIGHKVAESALKKQMLSPSHILRARAINAAARHKLGSCLPDIQKALSHSHILELESAAYAVGIFGDESALKRLEELSSRRENTLSMAALISRHRLGDLKARDAITERAKKGDLFALSTLSEMPKSAPLLEKLLKSPNADVRLGSTLALLRLANSTALETAYEFLLAPDLGFSLEVSASGALEAFCVRSLHSDTLKKRPDILSSSKRLAHTIIFSAASLGTEAFIPFAKKLLFSRRTDLVPLVAQALTLVDHEEAIKLLKECKDAPGMPFLRAEANLTLFYLTKEEPYFDEIKAWALKELSHKTIKLEPTQPTLTQHGEVAFELKAEEKTELFLKALLVIAQYESDKSALLFLQAMEKAPPSLQCALAALLIQALQ